MTTATVRGREQADKPLPWRRLLGVAGGVVLGAVLLFAAWSKALDPHAFAEAIRAEGLDFLLPAPAVAMIALALEVGLGLALVLGLRRLWVLVPVTLLVAFFTALTGRTYWRASHGLLTEGASCGCFGNLVERTPAEAFWQDLFLLLPPLVLAWLGRDRSGPRGASATVRRFPPVRTSLVAVAVVGTLVFAWKAPELPLDDLATRLHPGARVSAVCAGSGAQKVCLDSIVPGLDEGEHWVVLMDLESPSVEGLVDRLNAYSLAGSGPPLAVVAAAVPENLNTFYFQWGPAFPIHAAPAALVRPLYRRLPRSFLVEDGTVTRTFDGLPPTVVSPSPDGSERSGGAG